MLRKRSASAGSDIGQLFYLPIHDALIFLSLLVRFGPEQIESGSAYRNLILVLGKLLHPLPGFESAAFSEFVIPCAGIEPMRESPRLDMLYRLTAFLCALVFVNRHEVDIGNHPIMV